MPDRVDLLFFFSLDEESPEEILRKDSDKAATEICCGLEQRVTIVGTALKFPELCPISGYSTL